MPYERHIRHINNGSRSGHGLYRTDQPNLQEPTRQTVRNELLAYSAAASSVLLPSMLCHYDRILVYRNPRFVWRSILSRTARAMATLSNKVCNYLVAGLFYYKKYFPYTTKAPPSSGMLSMGDGTGAFAA